MKSCRLAVDYMSDLLNYFSDGSCGSFKKSVRSGIDIFTVLFVFLCLFFSLVKVIGISIVTLIKKIR